MLAAKRQGSDAAYPPNRHPEWSLLCTALWRVAPLLMSVIDVMSPSSTRADGRRGAYAEPFISAPRASTDGTLDSAQTLEFAAGMRNQEGTQLEWTAYVGAPVPYIVMCSH